MKMKIKTNKILLIVVLYLLTAMVTSGVAEGQQKNYGGTLVAHMLEEGPRLMDNYDFTDFWPSFTIFNKLVGYDPVTFDINPDIAERWDVSSDAKVYTFYLAKGIKFHDGTDCTSADVKWTYESVVKEKGYWAEQLSVVEKIETPDEYTVRFTLKNPDAAFLATCGSYYSPHIIPKHLYEGTDVRTNPYNVNAVGTGAYKLEEWVRGSYMTLVRNEEFFKFRPYLDKIVIRFAKSWSVALAALESGEIQYSYDTPPASEAARLNALPGVAVGQVTWPVIQHVDFNLKRKPYDDLRVRQAIAAAIDSADINDKAFAGLAQVERGMYLSNCKWAYNPEAQGPEFDPQRAERLLDEAGLKRGPDGIRFKMEFTTYTRMGADLVADVIKQHLRKVGIDANIQALEWSLYAEKIFTKRDFDVALAGGLVGPDPSALEIFVKSNGFRNVMGYNNSRVDELLQEGRRTVRLEDRKAAYFEVQQILAKDLPRASVILYVWLHPYRTDFQGFFFQPEYSAKQRTHSLEGVFWAKAPPATTTRVTTTTPVAEPLTPVAEPLTPVAEPLTSALLAVAVIVIAAAGVFVWSKRRKGASPS